ncbi:DUF3375 domain-containing protein [Herbaspirillum huttiense]|uniref:DUF3375 domain-containing protein n=1 Tax=Herbaspirillum huttiense TaxID=863372 RepID=UPI002176CFA4|nr:DUF3375 domain-containing protein [Herbaspirillum huttiense]UWE15649.1 DUF3375 domain-containing protein [Herbaspirillum huttiense]
MGTYGVLGLYGDLRALREQPNWKLLGAHSAPSVAACLYCLFLDGPDRKLPASALHERLARHLDQLRSIGVEMPQAPQAYVIDWLNHAWLRRNFPEGSTEEQYELTADAADALRYLIRLNRPKSLATESRLTSVLQLLQSLAEATDHNPETRLAALYAERERLDAQIEAVEQGRFTTLPVERAVERSREIILQGEELLGDFHKVRERFAEINLQLRKDLVESDGARGEVLANIFDGIDVIKQTEAGKVFEAFWALLIDPIASAKFEEALLQVVARPFASSLDIDERRFLAHLKSRLIDQAAAVHGVQASFASSLQTFVRSREFAEQRRISKLLKSTQQAALAAAETNKLNRRLDFYLIRTSAAIRSASQWQLFDPIVRTADASMEATAMSSVRIEDIQEMVNRSEIDMRSLRRNLRAALADSAQVSIGEILGRFPAEQGLGTVVGYLHLAVRHAAPADGREIIRWEGKDETWRRATAPLFYFLRERLHEIAD